MHGNVLEMCRDYYGFYSGEDEIDPKGKNSGSRICRGGSFYSYAACCRSSTRNRTYQSNNDGFPSLGFRLALVWAGDTEKYKPVHYENKGGRLSISVPDEIIFDD